MRIFLIELVASTVASIALWNFRLAHSIWPAHPIWATTLVVGVGVGVLDIMLRRDAQRDAALKTVQR